ncbi:LLM class F420-dependent oxidoreductase [Actinomadura sp. NEAU-AAG7]|uniref:LLM class F420-dependent oxidoreductase n=1 Tax=Actinomadura sp. NEAU-AAG7 TaxID=2839640 RepID=UPI001BE41A4F|nr:LLM class F420-dependent oxidoreductase [Actinomadura sp. NEAU-AAG7]MBT2208104.1 LLM class F420-dependent oxidoreductase [Actinomadura sp. NEAU-AAG7]
MPLHIGLYAPNMHGTADLHGTRRIATLAEDLGYDSLWVADHVVVPAPRVEPSPIEPDEPLLDPLVTLAYIAAVTSRIRLATGCVVVPQRNPLVLAKQLASVDVLSGGRLHFGAVAGYLVPELRTLGVDVASRGRRLDESLRAIFSLWYDRKPSFHGEFVDFEGVDAHPRPIQRPVPLVIGGHSAPAHRRAVTDGDEWYGFMLGLRATAEQLRLLRGAADGIVRDKPPLKISVTPARRLDPDVVRSFAELGVDRLVIAAPAGAGLAEFEEFVVNNAPERLEALARGQV